MEIDYYVYQDLDYVTSLVEEEITNSPEKNNKEYKAARTAYLLKKETILDPFEIFYLMMSETPYSKYDIIKALHSKDGLGLSFVEIVEILIEYGCFHEDVVFFMCCEWTFGLDIETVARIMLKDLHLDFITVAFAVADAYEFSAEEFVRILYSSEGPMLCGDKIAIALRLIYKLDDQQIAEALIKGTGNSADRIDYYVKESKKIKLPKEGVELLRARYMID